MSAAQKIVSMERIMLDFHEKLALNWTRHFKENEMTVLINFNLLPPMGGAGPSSDPGGILGPAREHIRM
jgi:hypothetical protein